MLSNMILFLLLAGRAKAVVSVPTIDFWIPATNRALSDPLQLRRILDRELRSQANGAG